MGPVAHMNPEPVWEMGSEFHLDASSSAEAPSGRSFLPLQGELHVSGRAALIALLQHHDGPGECWLTEYAFPNVVAALTDRASLRRYSDYPDSPFPDFNTLRPSQGDIVIVQDTFGLGDPEQWRSWMDDHPGVTVIEDITHNCTQERFLDSPAHFVFASVRKSVPTADGGIVFGKNGGLRRVSGTENAGALMKLRAMRLKAEYLQGQPVDKSVFRELQVRGNALLTSANQGPCLSHTLRSLRSLRLGEMRSRWVENNIRLRQGIAAAQESPDVSFLLPRSGKEPLFHAVLQCQSPDQREALRQHLLAHAVYPAIHWSMQNCGEGASQRSLKLSDRLITVPTDFRYGDGHIDQLCDLIIAGLRRKHN